MPPSGNSAVFRALNPDSWHWSLEAHLTAMQVDGINMLVWSKTKDAQRKRPKRKPKPIPRPGMAERQARADRRFKDVQAVPLDELKQLLAMPRREATAEHPTTSG